MNLACSAISLPWSQVNECQRWIGRRCTVSTRALRTASAEWPSGSGNSMTRRRYLYRPGDGRPGERRVHNEVQQEADQHARFAACNPPQRKRYLPTQIEPGRWPNDRLDIGVLVGIVHGEGNIPGARLNQCCRQLRIPGLCRGSQDTGRGRRPFLGDRPAKRRKGRWPIHGRASRQQCRDSRRREYRYPTLTAMVMRRSRRTYLNRKPSG